MGLFTQDFLAERRSEFMQSLLRNNIIRYWYRELIIRSGKKKYSDLPDYDAIWFEGWATRLGEKHFK